MRRTAACAILAVVAGLACWIVQGPLPGDVWITRALQSVFGTAPAWAQVATETAKAPWLWGTLAVAIGLEHVRKPGRLALVPAIALLAALGLDAGLRAVLFVPRPSPELVAVLSPSASSGLPSSFGLVYGALFGMAIIEFSRQSRKSAAMSTLAIAAVVVGASARIVLGGHWSSQMASSLLVGAAAASGAQWLLARWGHTRA